MGIIPVINCPDIECVTETVEKIKGFLADGGFVHCDIADGTFTFHKTWNDPTIWATLRAPFNLEVHLMVEHPEKWIEPWLAAGAKRFLVHVESIDDASLAGIMAMCARRGAGVMLASNPETPVEHLLMFRDRIRQYQILSVHPGPSAQNFLPLTLDKIKFLRKMVPNAIIEVDGGINLETAKLVKDAGADFAVSASYIFNNGDPKAAYRTLQDV